MIKHLFGVLLGAGAANAAPVVAAFQSDSGEVALTTTDIIDAAAQFGDQGPGLRVDFSDEAHGRISDLLRISQGQMLRFRVCRDVVFEAEAPESLPSVMSIPYDGLGAANWDAGKLRGERPC